MATVAETAELCLEAEIAVLRDAVAASPEQGDLRVMLAAWLAGAGERTEAIEQLRTAIKLGTTDEMLSDLATYVLPGPTYQAHIAHLHGVLRPRVYLEIGVFKGETLALAAPPTCAFGVDPAPRAEADRAYAAPTTIHRLTSDAFFARLDSGDLTLPGKPDFAFIDGLHLFEQVLRDFINVERHAAPGAVALLHDTLPVAERAAERERRSQFWCGDVWKVVPVLRAYRPDLRLATVPTRPSGITIITRLDPTSRVLSDQFDEIVSRFMNLAFSASEPEFDASLRTPNDPAWITAWFRDVAAHGTGEPATISR